MTLWVDAQLSPRVAGWITANFSVAAFPVRDLGLRDAEDQEIFAAARAADVTIITKDSDFVDLLEQFGPPPKILWLTCGNTSNFALQSLLSRYLANALGLFAGGESLVEISSP